MIWTLEDRGSKRVSDIARAIKGAEKLILATDPDREGEAISWHVLEALRRKARPEGHAGRARDLQRHHQGCGAGGLAQPAPDRSGAGRRLSRPPRARLSRRLHPLARALAQAAGSALGRPRPIGGASPRLRPRTRDRDLQAARILVADRDARHQGRRRVRRAPRRRGRQEDHPPRHRQRRGGRGLQARSGACDLLGGEHRGEARQAPPLPAVHHLDPAAGGLAQARPRAGADHADRAAALRGRRDRRRDGRSHHLYANRRRRHGAGGRAGRPPGDRQGIRRPLRAGRAAQVHRPRPRTRRRPTRPSARPT